MVPGSSLVKLPIILLLLLWVAGGCGPATLYENAVELPEKGWFKDSALLFEPLIRDTSAVLNFGFSLNHDNQYPYSNLWLFIEVDGPQGMHQVDTMEFFLAEPDGEWIGKGSEKDKKLYWLYKGNVKMRHPGNYSFKVYHGMRRDWLEGIKEMSFWIEETKTP
jgi:gliding motility-associated lipoprotein GldH